VVFLNSDRFNGSEFIPLTSTEFHQMTGRAGRRGMDHIGFAVLVPGKFMDIRHIAKLTHASPSDVISQIKINFSMVLNLLLSHTPIQIEDLLKRSFATYLFARTRRKKEWGTVMEYDHRYLWQEFLRHLAFLKAHDFVTTDDKLTTDGQWASQLRVDQPLLIAQGFRLGVFPESDGALLAAVIASFVNENEFDDNRIDEKVIPQKLLSCFLNVRESLRPFAKQMLHDGFFVRPLFFRPAAAMYAWATGHSWEKVLSISEMAEGNLAMLILRTADNLRHIRSLKRVFPAAAETSANAIDAILQDPVVTYFEE
jgi:superfamily II RNA helicase